ncbi:MAG: hypothetical protein L0332_09980 [Chloroflexi bacterium]|nr:hypothetical protein [Chloroflexota bacterium]MCI0649118.1 hypothetical protein [Chloroflexota bacterium]MCI0727033.1 hypothetical protein [Chloroflexota bacterium]
MSGLNDRSNLLKVDLREIRRDVLLVVLVGLLVQGFWALRLEQPTYMDAYYYATNGQRLAAGAGFTEMIIWQFLDEPAGLPTPSHTYWMPLPSLLAAAGYALGGGFRAAQLPFWLLAGLLPALAYAISRLLTGERWQGWAAAFFTVAAGFYAAYLSQPTTFAPFALAGGGGLLAVGLAHRRAAGGELGGKTWWLWLAAGLAAGLAHLARADGVLLLLLGLAVLIFDFRFSIFDSNLKSKIQNPKLDWLVPLLVFPAGYLLVMSGWFVRSWLVTGRPLSAVGTQTLFLTTYDDLFAYGRSFDLTSYLAWGWGNILRSKVAGLLLALQTVVAIPGLVFLAPFILAGWISLYRRPATRLLLQPVTWYAVALFVTMSLLFTFPGGRGSLFHSSVAVWPWTAALAPVGIGLAVDWIAARLPHWKPARAKRLFSTLFIGVAFVLSLAVSRTRPLPGEDPAVFRQVAAGLPLAAVVMVGNAPAFYYHTGLAAMSVPNEPVEVLLAAAARYSASYLILNHNHPAPLLGLYTGEVNHPQVRLKETIGEVKVYEMGIED